MTDNICDNDVNKSGSLEEEMFSTTAPTDPPTLNENNDDKGTEEKEMVDKSIQIDMDCEPGDDPKKDKRYWQHLAGLRGAREQYLQDDIRELDARLFRHRDYIDYLRKKLMKAQHQIAFYKANRCQCQVERPVCKHVGSFGI